VSADRVTWVELAKEPLWALFSLDYVRVYARLNANGDLNGVTARIDNLQREGGDPDPRWCLACTLVDDFDKPGRDIKWLNTTGYSEVAENELDGKLFITLAEHVTDAYRY
jgi:hypothetical protein